MVITAAGCKSSTGPSGPTALVFLAGGNQNGPAGSPLPVKLVVEARNANGPVADVRIAVSVDAQAGGSVSPASATTGVDGTAQFTWTLGGRVGVQTLTARTVTENPITANTTATAEIGQAASVTAQSELLQFVPVGRAVPILPTVVVGDAFGNPIPGVTVTFEVIQGGSVLNGAIQTTDAQGRARLGGWTIGQDAQSYTIRGRIAAGAAAVFEARGIPAALTITAGQGQTVNVGTEVPVAPTVRATRDDGSPLPNVPITFTVIGGTGTVVGGSVLTGADGTARPTRWILGLTPGLNHIDASTLGMEAVVFNATGVTQPPASAQASGGEALSGFFGNYLIGTPEVTVRDAQGNPVAGITVAFVAAGGGTLTGANALTNFLGRAAPTSWRMGASGAQTVTATIAGGALPPILFNATASAPPASTFRIEVRYPNNQPTAAQRTAFDMAAARWQQLLISGAPPYLIFENGEDCGDLRGETVDGVVIMADLRPIDGVNGVLGAAGACIVRDEGFLPAQGIMLFDTADLLALESQGQLQNVIIHEMAHVLGFGTIWNFNPGPPLGMNAFLSPCPGADPTFNGQGARAAFLGAVAPNTTFTGVPVPVEAGGGGGTRCSHWRESTFNNELMTGFLNAGVNPLSAVTVRSFGDLGYVVNDALADSYTFQAMLQAAGSRGVQLVEGVPPGPLILINRQGRAVARIPRVLK